MKSLLSSKPVLWFLFLFNLGVAVAAGFGLGINLTSHDFHLDGAQQLMTSAGMGAVALGAGAALFQRRATRHASATTASAITASE